MEQPNVIPAGATKGVQVLRIEFTERGFTATLNGELVAASGAVSDLEKVIAEALKMATGQESTVTIRSPQAKP